VKARIIICGSRDWSDDAAVYESLMLELSRLGVKECSDVTIVHGACPTGADAIADTWASDSGANVERYPADWKQFGFAAGPMRNEAMANDGAELCLAFWDGVSRGTLSMVSLAVKSGIPVHVVPKRVSS